MQLWDELLPTCVQQAKQPSCSAALTIVYPGWCAPINLQGSCRPAPLSSLAASEVRDGYSRLVIPLNRFSFDRPADLLVTEDFAGCGGGGYWDVNTIELRNFRW